VSPYSDELVEAWGAASPVDKLVFRPPLQLSISCRIVASISACHAEPGFNSRRESLFLLCVQGRILLDPAAIRSFPAQYLSLQAVYSKTSWG
jgi:hypothetical protein